MNSLTIIRSKARLTKRWRMDGDRPVQDSAGQMTAGHACPVSITSPDAFCELLQRLDDKQALTYGVTLDGHEHPITTKKRLPDAKPGTIARDNDHFRWPEGTGWLMLDYDPAPTGEPLQADDLLQTLYDVCPKLAGAAMVWGTSGSSHIVNTDTGEEVTGLQGQRLYVLVADARDIPRAGKTLFDRLWLAGHGRYDISRAGSLLERTLIDSAVWQPSRLDFAAPPVCVAPLTSNRPAPIAKNNDAPPLNTAEAIPSLTLAETEQLKEIKTAARAEESLQAEQQIVRESWIDERVRALPATLSDEEREAAIERLHNAITDRRLWGDFKLIHQSGRTVTVGELLDDPDRWHGERFADPLDPGQDMRVAWLNLRSGGRPYLWSHAHGGQRFTLLRPVAVMKLARGDAPRAVGALLERVRTDGVIYERAGLLVRLADGELVVVEPAWLRTYLEQCFQFQTFDARSGVWRNADCPQDLVARVMAERGNWNVAKVAGIVTFPVMRPDGTIIARSGFDSDTHLLFLDDTPDRTAPRALSVSDLRQTLCRIWEPFARFPFADDLSRGVFMAALLTTVCRATIPTAPAWLIRAYAPGTGKSLLSECLMLLAGAPMSALPLPEGNPEEIEKRLFAALLTGRAGLVLDNLSGVFESAALCAFLTSAEPEGRILGKSEMRTIQNRCFMVLNGNNVSPGGDLFRRVLPVTLDANEERPETRQFTFDPRDLIRDRLQAYQADLLSVLLTFQAAGAPVIGDGGFGSFDAWERLIRQCVCWLIAGGLAPAPMADPLDALELSKTEDPHHAQHIAVLEAWHARYGTRAIQVRDLADLMRQSSTYRSAEENALCEVLTDVGIPIRGRDEFEPRYFAGWLRRHRGRVVAGLRLDQAEAGTRGGSATWTVRQV